MRTGSPLQRAVPRQVTQSWWPRRDATAFRDQPSSSSMVLWLPASAISDEPEGPSNEDDEDEDELPKGGMADSDSEESEEEEEEWEGREEEEEQEE